MSESTPYSVPKEPGRWRAIFLAAAVHAALVAFLWIGIRWQNETPVSVDAEVWNLTPKEAAPEPRVAPPPSLPAPTPVPKEEPKPVVQAPPRVVTPPVVTPPVVNPEIAIEREKKRQQEVARQRDEERREKLAEDRREKLEAEKRREAEKLREKKLEQRREQQADARAAEAKAVEEKRRDDQQKRKLLEEQQKKQLAEDQRKKQLALQQQQKQAAAEAKAADDRRNQDLNRLQNQANAGSGGSGSAARSQGVRADSSYVSRVGAKIKSNTAYNVPDELSNNSAVEYAVELLPDGSVRGVTKHKSSGVPGFDEAVARAIQKSAPFPPDKTGSVPSGFTLVHRPKD
jgi:colicin import membrane protein